MTQDSALKNAMSQVFGRGWAEALCPYIISDDFMKLGGDLMEQRKKKIIYPEHENVFRAFKETPFKKVKVVFLGLDPYINKGEALGRSFGVDINMTQGKIPPSLRIIHKELESDIGKLAINFDWTLEGWAEQGVLMLNTALTVEHRNTGSHLALWDPFTKAVITALNKKEHVIWVLLGKEAQEYKQFLKRWSCFVVSAEHIENSKIFTRCNEYLYAMTMKEINWNIIDKET